MVFKEFSYLQYLVWKTQKTRRDIIHIHFYAELYVFFILLANNGKRRMYAD